ncbi:DUF3862 domain-containing protein [Merdimmobilis hominis]|uniref:DUF3862 domain-containing protein n=1 Tax=Merdimmobilis hominis TaxID=2897707 RepID=UPI0033655DD4
MSEMYCKYCGKQIYDCSKYCRYCGKPTDPIKSSSADPAHSLPASSVQSTVSPAKKFGSVVVLILSLVAVVGCIFVIKYFQTRPDYITLKEYNQIKPGQTYSEVVNIIGSNGVSMSETEYMGYTAQVYTWDGNGSTGSNATIMFSNGKVLSKAQIGLK